MGVECNNMTEDEVALNINEMQNNNLPGNKTEEFTYNYLVYVTEDESK